MASATLSFNVLCSAGAGETENLCTVRITAKAQTPPPAPFDHSFTFAPGTNASDIAAYFAAQMQAAGYTVAHTPGRPEFTVSGISERDQTASEGRQVIISVTGGAPDRKPPLPPPPPPKIRIMRGASPVRGSLSVYAAGVSYAIDDTPTIRLADATIQYEAADSAEAIAARLCCAMTSAGWTATLVASNEVEFSRNGWGLIVCAAALLPFNFEFTTNPENDDHWTLVLAS